MGSTGWANLGRFKDLATKAGAEMPEPSRDRKIMSDHYEFKMGMYLGELQQPFEQPLRRRPVDRHSLPASKRLTARSHADELRQHPQADWRVGVASIASLDRDRLAAVMERELIRTTL